jgi:putative hemolysin
MQVIAQDNQVSLPHKPHKKLRVELAISEADIRASQRLRYQIFAEEMGAHLPSAAEKLDRDHYDPYCQHMLVKDTLSGEVIGSTRILSEYQARKAGGFYSESEFDLSRLLPLQGHVIEIGRTCIHPQYRKGRALSLLWAALAKYMDKNRVDYLFGCASIPMHDGGYQAHSIMDELRNMHLADEAYRVNPALTLPEVNEIPARIVSMPPLLKAYLRLGLKVCGEACWDPDFNVADVFVLLDRKQIDPRYVRHYMDRKHAGLSA